MKIGYRRYSGRIFLGDFLGQQISARGAWLEKRIALFKYLKMLGHEIIELNTEYSPVDLLMIEFAGQNKVFYEKDIKATFECIEKHAGKIVYLCDDPDLFFPYAELPNEDWSRWTFWNNATPSQTLIEMHPKGSQVMDFPFGALLEANKAVGTVYEPFMVYSGRPNGRGTVLKALISSGLPLRIYGHASEWEGYGVRVRNSPTQIERAQFYSNQMGCFGLSDKKHKTLRWRTGRVLHAIFGGCPVLSDVHPAFGYLKTFKTLLEAKEVVDSWRNPTQRNLDREFQLAEALNDRLICIETTERVLS